MSILLPADDPLRDATDVNLRQMSLIGLHDHYGAISLHSAIAGGYPLPLPLVHTREGQGCDVGDLHWLLLPDKSIWILGDSVVGFGGDLGFQRLPCEVSFEIGQSQTPAVHPTIPTWTTDVRKQCDIGHSAERRVAG